MDPVRVSHMPNARETWQVYGLHF